MYDQLDFIVLLHADSIENLGEIVTVSELPALRSEHLAETIRSFKPIVTLGGTRMPTKSRYKCQS